jgi:hypothetical protein
VIAVDAVAMAIVLVIDVIAVLDGSVSTVAAVDVVVPLVRRARFLRGVPADIRRCHGRCELQTNGQVAPLGVADRRPQ